MPPVSGNNWGQHVPRPQAVVRHPSRDASTAPAHLRASPVTPWNPESKSPRVAATSYVDPTSVLIGDVRVADHVLIAPLVSIRADEGTPIAIGSESSVQDGVVIHGLPSQLHGEPAPTSSFQVGGEDYSVYVSERVSVEHQAQIHGPAFIDREVWIGMQALVSGARIGRRVVIEPGARVLGVTIPSYRYVPAGVVVNRQSVADQLPEITAGYVLRHRNQASVEANRVLLEAILQQSR